METNTLIKLLKVVAEPLFSSTFTSWPRPFPMAMAFLIVIFCRGSPGTWITKETSERERSLKVAEGCQVWIASKKPFTFQTLLHILAIWSLSVNLNRKRLGPKTAKEKGFAKNQALAKAALTVWLFWVFWEIKRPTRGNNSEVTCSWGMVSSWEDGSSHERAAVWAIRDSIS